MSDDGRRQALTKQAIRAAPAATLPGLAGPPPPPVAPALARAAAPTLPGHDATIAAAPGRPAAPMPAATEAPLELHAFDAPTAGRRRTLVMGGVALAAVALFVGLRLFRRASPPTVVAPRPAVAAAPVPPVAVEPLEAPVPAKEIAAEPSPAPAPKAHKTPRARHRAVAHAERAAAPQERHRPTKKRALAMKEKPTGDRAGARAAYQRGNDLLLTGNAAGAIDAYQEAVRLAPSDPVGYRGLGLAYEKEGKNKDAIAALVSYLRLSRHARDREVIARRLYRLTHTD